DSTPSPADPDVNGQLARSALPVHQDGGRGALPAGAELRQRLLLLLWRDGLHPDHVPPDNRDLSGLLLRAGRGGQPGAGVYERPDDDNDPSLSGLGGTGAPLLVGPPAGGG